MTNSFVMIIDPLVSPFPIVTEPTDADVWPSAKATAQFFANLKAIHNRGYAGVRLTHCELLPNGQLLIAPAMNVDTPEGRMAELLHRLAAAGRQPPTDEVMAIIERVYRKQSLPLPNIVDRRTSVTHQDGGKPV